MREREQDGLFQMKEQLEQMKREYHEIRIPAQARQRMLDGIRQAREEQEETVVETARPQTQARPRPAFYCCAKPAAAVVAAALLAITVMANSGPGIANAMERIPVIGAIARVVTFRTYNDRTNAFEADIEIPRVTADNGQEVPANRSIEEYAGQLIARYEEELAASNGQGHYGMDSRYEVVTDNQKYLSIRINTMQVMASGVQYVKIFTIDKETGETVELKDLLGDSAGALEAVGENIKEQMAGQMRDDPEVAYFYNSETPEWDFKGLRGDESYYFNANGELVIAFDEYQVAPGYMGAVEFTISKEITKPFGI